MAEQRPSKRAKIIDPDPVDEAWLFKTAKGLSDAEVLACMRLHGQASVIRLNAETWRAKDSMAGPIFALGGKGEASSSEALMEELRPHCRQSGVVVVSKVTKASIVPTCGLLQCLEATFEEEGPDEAQLFVILEGFLESSIEADSVWGDGATAVYALLDAEAPIPPASKEEAEGSMATLLGMVQGAIESGGNSVDREVARPGETVVVTKENELDDCCWDPSAYQAEEAAVEAALAPEERQKQEDAKSAAQITAEIREWDDENYMKYRHIGGGRKKLVNMNAFRKR